MLIKGVEKPIRVLCTREIQNSIDDSVHLLLTDQVKALGLSSFYTVLRDEIRGTNGTTFSFEGLHGRSVDSLKSFEGADICWVEEANSVLKRSWDILTPTIRRDGSEIWISFNPELETDETYKRFVLNPPPGSLVKKVTYRDNPWFPKVLQAEMEHMKQTDFDSYLCVWEGHTRVALDGAIYANELRLATLENRLTRVPYERAKPVQTFWDLGKSDNTAIWFAQVVGFEFRVIDYYQSHGQNLSHYVKILREKPYTYGWTWLPHDAQHDTLASELTIEQQLRAQNFDVRISPKLSVDAGIEAARTVFGKTYFDQEKAADGIQCLRHYQFKKHDDGLSYSKVPLHNWASHGADAFRYLAVSLTDQGKAQKIKYDNRGIV